MVVEVKRLKAKLARQLKHIRLALYVILGVTLVHYLAVTIGRSLIRFVFRYNRSQAEVFLDLVYLHTPPSASA